MSLTLYGYIPHRVIFDTLEIREWDNLYCSQFTRESPAVYCVYILSVLLPCLWFSVDVVTIDRAPLTTVTPRGYCRNTINTGSDSRRHTRHPVTVECHNNGGVWWRHFRNILNISTWTTCCCYWGQLLSVSWLDFDSGFRYSVCGEWVLGMSEVFLKCVDLTVLSSESMASGGVYCLLISILWG